MLLIKSKIAALVFFFGLLPRGAPLCEFLRWNQQVKLAVGNVKGDQIAIADQGERRAEIAFRET